MAALHGTRLAVWGSMRSMSARGDDNPADLRSAGRSGISPDDRNGNLGLRLAKSLVTP